jgi:hypothetical protein
MSTMFESLLPFLAALKRQNMPSQDQDDDESNLAANQFMSAANGGFDQPSNGFNQPGTGFGFNQQGQRNTGARADSGEDQGPPDMSSLPQAALPNLFPDSPAVPRFAPSAQCTGKIENYINDGLQNQRDPDNRPSGPVVFLGPTDMRGKDGDVDPDNKPGWRNGAWNFDFFVPGMKSAPAGWKQGRDPKSGLHLPPPGGEDPVTPHYGPGTYNGQPGFYVTGHFDSANPLSGNPLDLFKHVVGDVLLKTPHGC